MAGCGATERDWQAWIPLEVVKSSKGDMRIGGIATDENAPDLQGEKVFVQGLDTSYLTNRGVWNWNHGKEPGDILGEIDLVQKNLDRGTLYVEGFLYPGVKKAVDTFELMRSLKDVNSNRKLGLSVEGKVKERDGEHGKQIKKAWIRAVAITYDPINQGAWVDMIKSFGASPTYEPCSGDCSKCPMCTCEVETKKSDLDPRDTPGVDPQPLIPDPRDPLPESHGPQIDTRDPEPNPSNVCPNCGKYKRGEASDEICMCDIPISVIIPDAQVYAGLTEKAIAAGHDIPATSGGVSGSAQRCEDLDQDAKPTTFDERHLKDKKKKREWSKSELTELFINKYGDARHAELLAELIFKAAEIGAY